MSLCLASPLFPAPTLAASDITPQTVYVFRPAANGSVPDEQGSNHPAKATLQDSSGWIDTDRGPALELKEDDERVDAPYEIFPDKRGTIQITFRPTVDSEKPQQLFRVYGRADGLSLYLQSGALTFRYYNRLTKQRVSVALPAQATQVGTWVTATASWDFENERKIFLQVKESKRAQTVSADMQVEFSPDSRVIFGNEHNNESPFRGAIESIRIYNQPLWGAPTAKLDDKTTVVIPKTARARVLPKTLFFSRTQPKYDLFSNPLLRRWVDRPLFFDRRTAAGETPTSIVSPGSFLKTQESLRAYGLDGFGTLLAAPFQGVAFFEMLDIADTASDTPLVPIVMEIAGFDEAIAKGKETRFLEQAKRALRSPNVLRVNGKILVISYAMDLTPLPVWQAFKTAVREELGDEFLFVIDVTSKRPPLLREFQEFNGVTATTLANFQNHLREWLDVSDGIMWAGGSHTNRPDGTLDRKFYRDFLVPTIHQVLNEKPYQQKLFGLDAEVGYINVMTSRRINWEEHTRRLRDNLQIALEAQPDFIAMPEWDELNENTSIAPTLTNSLTTQRIIRAFMEQFPGQKSAAEEDTDIPNLIISYRPYLKLGEWLEVEVLSLPEKGKKGDLSIELSLKNREGKVVQSFPGVRLSRESINDHLFRIPSESLAAESVLIPHLKVTTPEGQTSSWEEGLEAMRLLATWNLNYKSTKIHLRDLLQPQEASFKLRQTDGVLQVEGKVKADEAIASVEVVQDSRELYAYDPKNELVAGPGEALIHLHWQAMRNPVGLSGTIEVQDGTLKQFVDWRRPEYKRASYRLDAVTNDEGKLVVPFITDEGVNATNSRGGFFVITDPERARLVMKTDRFTAEFPVKELLKSGQMARVFPHGVTVEALSTKMLSLIPYPILENEVAFTTIVHAWRRDTPLQMRVVTTSGKIYRSAPILPEVPSPEQLPLPVWSESKNQPMTLQVAANRIPDITPQFSPALGNALLNTESSYFYGLAGGVPFDMAAFSKRHLSTSYPGNAKNTIPAWVTEDGTQCLRFDGKGNFIYFPEETVPRGSFTVEFEIKPTSNRPQILCAQRGYRAGGITLKLINNELTGEFIGRNNQIIPFQTGLSLTEGEWSKVRIAYDLTQLIITVNGKSHSVPSPSGPNSVINPFIFGGYGNGKSFSFFSGFLRSIRFHHTALEPAKDHPSRF